MKKLLNRSCIWVALLLLAILIVTGCGRSPTADPTLSPPTAAPSVTASPTATPAVTDTVPSAVAKLLVLRPDVHLGEAPQAPYELVKVPEQARIKVGDKAWAKLYFQGYEAELFGGAEVVLERNRTDSDGFSITILRLIGDHILVKANEDSRGLIQVRTDYATVTLSEGSEVIVCHAEALTCMATLKGEAQVEAQGQVVTIKAGEATFVREDEVPLQPTDTDPEAVRVFEDLKRGTGEAPSLPEQLGLLSPSGPRLECTVRSPVNLRSGPGTTYRRLARLPLPNGTRLEALGRNDGGSWIQVQVQGFDEPGWVSASTVYVWCDGAIADLPVSE
jgi:hypothetical protein